MWNLKSNTHELIYKQKQTHQDRKQTYGGKDGSIGLTDTLIYII